MRVNVKKNAGKIFNILVAPYNCQIRVNNAIVNIGRGSFSAILQMIIYGSDLLKEPTVVAEIGQYCEFNPSCELIIGGEHINEGEMINSFSGSIHLQHNIINKENIATRSKGRIFIGNNVVISSKAVILSGAEIGDNVVIGACSLVNNKFNSNQIIGGVPAKILNKINAPKLEWWDLSEKCIAEFVNHGDVKNPIVNAAAKLRLTLNANLKQDGKVGDMELIGLIIDNKFIPIQEINSKYIEYFNNSNNDIEYINVADDIFDDLIKLSS